MQVTSFPILCFCLPEKLGGVVTTCGISIPERLRAGGKAIKVYGILVLWGFSVSFRSISAGRNHPVKHCLVGGSLGVPNVILRGWGVNKEMRVS